MKVEGLVRGLTEWKTKEEEKKCKEQMKMQLNKPNVAKGLQAWKTAGIERRNKQILAARDQEQLRLKEIDERLQKKHDLAREREQLWLEGNTGPHATNLATRRQEQLSLGMKDIDEWVPVTQEDAVTSGTDDNFGVKNLFDSQSSSYHLTKEGHVENQWIQAHIVALIL